MNQKTAPTKTSNPTNLPTSLQYLIKKLELSQHLKPREIKAIISEAKISAKDLSAWADFDHPVMDSYGRKLVYKGANFEIMVMSWRPGDFSSIHDHGHTQWGAVQLFGPAEHATFLQIDNQLITQDRHLQSSGDILEVGHSLIHQMGNPTSDKFFLSLHVYGYKEAIDNVTGDARIFDLEKGEIHRVDGGVFFGLTSEEITRTEPGPKGDFLTRLRYYTELIRRVRKIRPKERVAREVNLDEVIANFQSANQWSSLRSFIAENTDENGHYTNSHNWNLLNYELKEAAKLQNELASEQKSGDNFYQYASLYDAVICQPALYDFMARYLFFFAEKYQPDFTTTSLISLGCGTGLVEQHIIEALGLPYENLFGLDISPSMIAEANHRIQAEVGDVLTLDPSVRMWDLAYSGLNVFHYLKHQRLEEAIQKTASIIKPGGYFLGDFIAPDHIRWYPNVLFSANEQVISLRTPRLVEEDGSMFQESEIINLRFQDGQMRVTYAGKHRRFLPPINRIRSYFEEAFGGQVDFYDAITLKPIAKLDDSCSSTRYIVVAQKVLQ